MGWIKYKYSCRFQANGSCICDTPDIEIELSYNGKVLKVSGLIDSGCTNTNINAEIATYFGIDYKNLSSVQVGGIGSPQIGYIGNIDMKLKDFGDKFTSPATFVENLPVPVLLGQNNFFEIFDVKFEKRNNVFELKRNDTDRKSFISLLNKTKPSLSTPKKSRKNTLRIYKKTRSYKTKGNRAK